MQQTLKDYLIIDLKHDQGIINLLKVYKDQSKYELIDQLNDIIISEVGPIQIRAAILMMGLLSQIEEQSKKLQYENIYLKLMTHYKDNEGENYSIQAEVIGALLRRFNRQLSISDYDLFSLILAQKRSKMLRGLILLKEITSSKQWFNSYKRQEFKEYNGNITVSQELFYNAGTAVIHGVNEVIYSLISKWENKSEKEKSLNKMSQKGKDNIDINLLISVCLIQLQNQMTIKQKKKAFPLIVTQLNVQRYLEEDRDLLYNYLNLLKTCDSNFFLKREKQVFKKLTILIRMYDIEELKEYTSQTKMELEGVDYKKIQEETNQDLKIIEKNKYPAVILGMYVFEETIQKSLNKQSKFIPELIDFMFSLCELDAIAMEDLSSSQPDLQSNTNTNPNTKTNTLIKANSPELDQAFTDFQYQLETINQSYKKNLINDQIFQKVLNIVKKVGSGEVNKQNNNVIDYPKEDIRKLIGCYNMLYYQTNFNVDPIRGILGNLTKQIGFHLRNPYIKCFAIKFLFQITTQAINYILPFHTTFIDIIIDIAQNSSYPSSREANLAFSLLERLISKILYEEDFLLFDYIPKVYEICLNQYESLQFTKQPQIYQELIQNLINSILHKKKIEYYIKEYVQRSKEIFLSYVEKKKDQMEIEQKENELVPHQTSHLSCLSSLAKMVMKSQHCKDDDLVNRVKSLLRSYANELYQGKFDESMTSRTEIYQFMYSISIEFLNDQNLIDELFLKMYKHIIADCQVNTNLKLIRRNPEEQIEEQQNLPPIFYNHQGLNQLQQIIAQQGGQIFNINPNLENIVQNNNNPQNVQQNNQNPVQNNQQPVHNQDEENSDDYESVSEEEEAEAGDEDEQNEEMINLPINIPIVQQQQNQNQVEEEEEQGDEDDEDLSYGGYYSENEDYEQVYFEQPNPQLLALKSNALYMLGEFVQECTQIVMEYKKFEIIDVLMQISMNDREENRVIQMNYQTLGLMFKCIQQYYKKFYPNLYLTNPTSSSEEHTFLSEEAKVEYAPLFQIFLNQIDSLDSLNEDNIHEELLQKLSYVLRNIDNPPKRTFFKDIFNTVINNVKKTLHLLQSSLIDKQLECLQIIFKAYPSQLKTNFKDIWSIIKRYFFNPKEKSNQQQGFQGENDQEDEEEVVKEDEEFEDMDEEEEEVEQNNQKKKQNEHRLDLNIISSIIGYASHFIKYDKSVYPIISQEINKIILNKKLLEDEILLRNCIYYVNVIARYCYDIVKPEIFQQMFSLIGQIVNSKKLEEYDEKGTVENIYAAYAVMATKLIGPKIDKQKSKVDLSPFIKLYSIVPFEDDYPEMKRVILISEFLFDQDLPLIEQNLSKIVLSTVLMINEPTRYRIKQKSEVLYYQFYQKLVQRYPQTSSLAHSIIDQNKNNTFKEKDVILKKLNLI